MAPGENKSSTAVVIFSGNLSKWEDNHCTVIAISQKMLLFLAGFAVFIGHGLLTREHSAFYLLFLQLFNSLKISSWKRRMKV